MLQEKQKKRQDEISAVVKYCVENDCKGYEAITSGLFPTTKDPRTINRRLPREKPVKEIKTSNHGRGREVLLSYTKNRGRKLAGKLLQE